MDGLDLLKLNKNEEIERRVLMYILSAKASDKKNMTNFDVLAILWHALVQKPLGFCLIDSDRLLENSRLKVTIGVSQIS